MYLFFDITANGKPKSWKAEASDTFNWPRLIKIAWLVINKEKKPVKLESFLIKPEGFEVLPEVEDFTGITQEIAVNEGTSLVEVLEKFSEAVDAADYIVAHNFKLDSCVVAAEFDRKMMSHKLFSADSYCLMQEGTYFCKLPGKRGNFKWPTMTELYLKMFGKKLLDSQNPVTDVKACASCFIKLVALEEIELNES